MLNDNVLVRLIYSYHLYCGLVAPWRVEDQLAEFIFLESQDRIKVHVTAAISQVTPLHHCYMIIDDDYPYPLLVYN